MSRIPNYCIRYNSNPQLVIDNHMSEVMFLLDTDERNFDSIDDAIKFLNECTSPITKIEDIVPELKKLRKDRNFNWILPESHIRPKHILMDDMDETVVSVDDEDGDVIVLQSIDKILIQQKIVG